MRDTRTVQKGAVRLISFARFLSFAALVIAGSALVGYATGQRVLIQIGSTLRAMSPLTAVGLIGVAAAVLAISWHRANVGIGAAALALCTATVALLSHALVGADILSPAIASSVFGVAAQDVGRTSLATGVSLLLLSVATVARRARPFWADVASAGALIISGTALVGYLYDVADLYALPVFNTMALNTAVALASLSLASLLVEPSIGWVSVLGSGDVGGRATRRQLSFVVLPVFAGWFLLRAANAGAIGMAAAMALLVVVTIVPLAILVLRDGLALNAFDHARRDKEDVQVRLAADMERKLLAQAEELARASAARAEQEAAMSRTQRMEAVGQLTGGIAHDFNNLLMAIRGNLELVQRRLSPDEDRLHRYLSNALAGTDKGAKVTGQLLAFSRSQKLQVRPVELTPVLESARTLIGSSLGPSIEIILDFDIEGTWAIADADQLELALLNLAVNARDAMPDGGVLRIESRLADKGLQSADGTVENVAIRVVDDGTGMTEEVLAHALEPFFTTKDRDKGTGLGLPQVYGFVRQCGGDLRITSAAGVGTTVEILLRTTPAVDESTSAAAGTSSTIVTSDTMREILVVDDDDAVREVIVDALRSAGFSVLEASNGEAGLALLNTKRPAAAVLDFLMPGMNGAELARLAQIRRPGLPIVFVSGYSDTVALDGITGAVVLRKPFDILALEGALSSVIH